MEKCIQCLVQNGYGVLARENSLCVRLAKVIDTNLLVIELFGPDESDPRFLLRGDFVENHDRWSNCEFKKWFKDEEDFVKNWHKFWWFEEEEDE